MAEHITVYTDGGSRGNPGPGAAGFVLLDSCKKQIGGKGFFLGETTNNVAEYRAVVEGLKAAAQAGAKAVCLFSDSELIVKQINGQYRVKSDSLRPIHSEAMEILNSFSSWKVEYIRREQNTKADALVNLAMDRRGDVEAKTSDPFANQRHLRLGVLLSGGGRTMMNILEQIQAGKLNAEISVVISSRSTVAGVERARAAGLDVKIIRKKDHPDVKEFSEKIKDELVAAKVDLVVQAGWLCLWRIPEIYGNMVMNIHPALLPSFGGKGMWGHHVHEAVLQAGCKVSGCTVHFCTNEYDKGQILVQRCCEVKDDDDADVLAARVFEQECIAYPEAIKLFAEGKLPIGTKS